MLCTMGALCGRHSLSSVPDPITGLTEVDIKHIKDMWFFISIGASFKEIGIGFFIKLFHEYPYLQDYFSEFIGQDDAHLRKSLSLRAHGIAVFTSITSYVDSLDDSSTLVALIHKRTKFHYVRGITFRDMENLKAVLLMYLEEHTKGYRDVGGGLEAWERFLTLHNDIYLAKIEELEQKFNPVLTPETSKSTKLGKK